MKDLLSPRFKVIEPYPRSRINVGVILYRHFFDSGNHCYTTDPNGFLNAIVIDKNDVEGYPHLFKPLPWHEDRELEDMPEYVKVITERSSLFFGHVHKITKWFPDREDGYICNIEGKDGLYRFRANIFLPATPEDYNNYINSKA